MKRSSSASSIGAMCSRRSVHPTGSLPILDPSALLAVPGVFFDPFDEPAVFGPTFSERAASAAVSTLPFG